MSLAARLKKPPEPDTAEPRVLTIDIETSPHLAYTFSMYDANISADMVVRPSRVLCFAAKWLDERQVMFFSERDPGRKKMIEAAWELLDAADIVVTYNGPGFDKKHLQREFLLAGLAPPSGYVDVDLLQVVRRRFKFPSNRLGAIGESLGIGGKLDTGGWRLWQAVLDGDDKAWETFEKYNRQDVTLTEQLYDVLAPWITGAPHRGLWSGDMGDCPACGSDDLELVGVTFDRARAYPRVQCRDCAAFSKVLRNGETRRA